MASSDLSAWLTGRGAVPAADVREGLGVSPATLSRLVARAPREVLRLGRGRSVHYALARRLGDLPARVPVYRIDAAGNPTRVAALTPLSGGGTWLEPDSGAGHAYQGLPPVLADMAPAGYLGRRFSQHHDDLGLPSRLQDWNDDQRFLAVGRRGDDCPGDLVIGEESLDRLLANPPELVSSADFPHLAEDSALGGAGSSAAGEQPKFTAYMDAGHCIVKFTPGDGSDADRRWRDLLVCESLALTTLASAGAPAAETSVVDEGSRRFLVVRRFDRVGARGRRGTLTLGPLDDDLFGGRDSWTAAAARLGEAGLLDADDRRRVVLLDAFGIWIANGDRHFGNLSFFADGLAPEPALKLAPAYDMLPMNAAPVSGILPELTPDPPTPRAMLLDVWDEARELAAAYWRSVAGDDRVSDGFRESAARRAV